MKFDNPAAVEQIVWDMRLADLPRGENRTIINQLYNGDPPYDEAKAEENNIEINRNDLSGVNLLTQARRQWNQAFLTTENYFSVTLDSGPAHKRAEWGRTITRHANRYLKQSRTMMEQVRATGANTMLHGVAPVVWENRKNVIPTPIYLASFLTPSETLIDFSNCDRFAIFREWTPAQLWEMTHGRVVDPGWQMDTVNSQIRYVSQQVMKQPNATAFQYMPERIEELAKQDMGFWGSDAVPTIDAWDFYFRDKDDGLGWKRRIILDWDITDGAHYDKHSKPPKRDSEISGQFLYTSKNRKFANSMSEIVHCQFGDCSAVAPFKVHSVRSLGWMLWGVCDLQNRLHCKFNEAVFESLMWFFRTASNADLLRLKKANFTHMGIIPAGIAMVKNDERYVPDAQLIQMAFGRNAKQMQESAAAFSNDFDKGAGDKEMTATETMARVNAVNALVSGMLSLAYTYEDFKYHEQARRLCIHNNPDPIAKKFRLSCFKDGVPPEYLDVERWRVQSDKILGAGNKTLGLAQAQFLQGIRKNLGPDAQRQVDHIAIEINTDDPALAEELAPVKGQETISNSMHDAQLATDRLMRGLPFVARPDMVFEDYVKVWLADLQLLVNRQLQSRSLSNPDQLLGFKTMHDQIQQFIEIIAQDPEEKEKVKAYTDTLGNLMNAIKGLAQQFDQARQKQNGNGAPAPDPKAIVQAQSAAQMAAIKQTNAQTSHSQRTAQKQVQFELEQQRKDRETNAEIRRENAKAAHELIRDRAAAASQPDTIKTLRE